MNLGHPTQLTVPHGLEATSCQIVSATRPVSASYCGWLSSKYIPSYITVPWYHDEHEEMVENECFDEAHRFSISQIARAELVVPFVLVLAQFVQVLFVV